MSSSKKSKGKKKGKKKDSGGALRVQPSVSEAFKVRSTGTLSPLQLSCRRLPCLIFPPPPPSAGAANAPADRSGRVVFSLACTGETSQHRQSASGAAGGTGKLLDHSCTGVPKADSVVQWLTRLSMWCTSCAWLLLRCTLSTAVPVQMLMAAAAPRWTCLRVSSRTTPTKLMSWSEPLADWPTPTRSPSCCVHSLGPLRLVPFGPRQIGMARMSSGPCPVRPCCREPQRISLSLSLMESRHSGSLQVETCGRLGWNNVFRMPYVSMSYELSLEKEDDKRLLKKLFHLNSLELEGRNVPDYMNNDGEQPVSRLLVNGAPVPGPVRHGDLFDYVVRLARCLPHGRFDALPVHAAATIPPSNSSPPVVGGIDLQVKAVQDMDGDDQDSPDIVEFDMELSQAAAGSLAPRIA